MTLGEIQEEDNLIAELKKEIGDLKRSNALLRKHKKLSEQELNNRKRITIEQFCARNNLTKGLYYALAKDGLAPKSYKLCNDKGEPIMKRSFINVDEEKEWQDDPKRWQQYTYDMSHTKQ